MRPSIVIMVLVLASFAGSSLWFSSNAILNELSLALPNSTLNVSDITSAVQLGFIIGTLTFALLNISDRFPAGRVFFISSILGSFSNALIVFAPLNDLALLLSRCLTGFFIAGIYPVAVKISALWSPKDLGRTLGFILAALVLGTAFPHLINGLGWAVDWQSAIFISSALALVGGVLVYFVIPEKSIAKRTPHHEGKSLLKIFKSNDFRASSTGYFGHMWELYTFWAFVPLILSAYSAQSNIALNIPLWSFFIIASGSIGCAVGGVISFKMGSARVAFSQLTTSGLCCLIFPIMLLTDPNVFLVYLLIWGITVPGDSPQFSTLNAQTAPVDIVGSAVTMVICLGFTLTIVSIYIFELLMNLFNLQLAVFILAMGPLFGLYVMYPLYKKNPLFN
jgi:MFS family permease